MKNFKKLMALVIAGAMVLGTMSFATADPGDLKWNSTLQVSGLDEGDTVKYYHIIDWDLDHTVAKSASDTTLIGWAWAAGSAYNDDTTNHVDLLRTIVGTTDGSGQISSITAGELAKNLGTAIDGGTVTGDTWTAENVESGLYMVIVTPVKTDTMYNPIFVAANFYGTGETPDTSNSIAISANELSYHNNGMAKKSTIPLEKTATDDDGVAGQEGDTNPAHTTDVGDDIDYTVKTKIPAFADNYTDPVFKLVDTLKGLEMVSTADTIEVYPSADGTGTKLVKDKDYTVTVNADKSGYTLTFLKQYLQNEKEADGVTLKGSVAFPAGGQDITIKYTAKVTDSAEKIINEDKNTVDLIFSAGPSPEDGYGLLRDETNHFTFSIDANLIGDEYSEESSTEAIKIGVDAEGNPIMSEKSYKYNGGVKHAALDGAEFTLLNANKEPYTSDIYPSGVTVYSDGTGRINIKGLDAGTYYLREVKAPNGFIKLQTDVEVVIKAKIKENVDVKDEVDNNGTKVKVTYKTNELEEYSVTINGQTTSYTITNSKAETIKTSRTVNSSDSELANTKGVELPSTGGMGTTLFYAIGAVLVLGAGILLVSKRRMAAN